VFHKLARPLSSLEHLSSLQLLLLSVQLDASKILYDETKLQKKVTSYLLLLEEQGAEQFVCGA
jgi:hypothetical protein